MRMSLSGAVETQGIGNQIENWMPTLTERCFNTPCCFGGMQVVVGRRYTSQHESIGRRSHRVPVVGG